MTTTEAAELLGARTEAHVDLGGTGLIASAKLDGIELTLGASVESELPEEEFLELLESDCG